MTQLLKTALDKEKRRVSSENETSIPTFAIDSDTQICGFFGKNRFLSNFYKCPNGIWYRGTRFSSTELAYQAAKWPDEDHKLFVNVTPSESKKLGNREGRREDWDLVKYDIMLLLVIQKFLTDDSLKQRLLNTNPKFLEERNYWKDTWWGTNENGVGENNLGKILMKVRRLLYE